MPLDVIMPALGMAQDTGQIVAWHKAPGDAVAEGDVLFEVETDKATMEVEAQGAGYLVDVAAGAGEDVPVGQVIARIADSPEGGGSVAAPASSDAPATTPDLPDGTTIIMPALGMAQDTGLLVGWNKEPGAQVAEGDILFEVETDKSTMEVPAGAAGYLAAVLAQAGDEVPVGETVAILTTDAPEAPVVRSYAETGGAQPAPAAEPPASPPAPPKEAATAEPAAPEPSKAAPTSVEGRILASPKARRLAREQGLDLARLVEAGHRQPYHVKDLDALRALPAPAATPAKAGVEPRRRLTARCGAEGLASFAAWLAAETGVRDPAPLLAAFAAASLRRAEAPLNVSVERMGHAQAFADADRAPLGRAEPNEAEPDLILRDLRLSPLASVDLGPEAVPVITLLAGPEGIDLTLECDAGALTAPEAIALLSDFAGRLDEPLRHLL